MDNNKKEIAEQDTQTFSFSRMIEIAGIVSVGLVVGLASGSFLWGTVAFNFAVSLNSITTSLERIEAFLLTR